MKFTEIYPNGFSSWTAYYRHKKKVEKIKYWMQGIVGMVVLFGSYAFCGYIDTMM